VQVDYYGNSTPIKQVANVAIEDARTLSITPWERQMIPVIEKAILTADLGLNPVTAGSVIRVPMPPLTEERRKEFVRIIRNEGENAKVSVRNIRRDSNTDVKQLLKEKEITEDDDRRAQEVIQKLTDKFIQDIDTILDKKEKDIMEV
jgi:ribosome recycling factor